MKDISRIVIISTSAYKEEDAMVHTNLTDDEITEVLTPLLMAERNNPGDDRHFVQDVVQALKNKYKDPRLFIDLVEPVKITI